MLELLANHAEKLADAQSNSDSTKMVEEILNIARLLDQMVIAEDLSGGEYIESIRNVLLGITLLALKIGTAGGGVDIEAAMHALIGAQGGESRKATSFGCQEENERAAESC